jgi:hypothetical protein
MILSRLCTRTHNGQSFVISQDPKGEERKAIVGLLEIKE